MKPETQAEPDYVDIMRSGKDFTQCVQGNVNRREGYNQGLMWSGTVLKMAVAKPGQVMMLALTRFGTLETA